MKNYNKYLLLFLIAFSYFGCTKPLQCGEALDLQRSAMLIFPFDNALDKYLYTENPFTNIFNRDSLKVINQDGTQPFSVSFLIKSDPRNQLNSFYAIKISPAFFVPDDNDAFNSEKTRKIYLKYNYNTIDTLSLVFKATKNKCNKSEYEYAKVFYKGNLLTTKTNDIYLEFSLKR